MAMVDTYEARKELAKAVAVICAAAKELDRLPEQEQFDVCWNLAFVELRGLEDYRIH